MDKTCRIAVFYDGTYFNKVSNYYLYQHERRARISIAGLHNFVIEQVAREESLDRRYCHIVDAAYFRGRLSAKTAHARDVLYSERAFEDILMRANVSIHQVPVTERNGSFEEKSIDVLLALEAYELASLKRYDLCVLITGDGDFVPLVRKLNTLGSRVMLLAWDFEFEHNGQHHRTRAAQPLIDAVTYPVMMSSVIDDRSRRTDPIINQLFVQPRPEPRLEAPKRVDSAERVEAPSPDALAGLARGPGARHSGVVLSVNEKGYGFIREAGTGQSLFFHATELAGCEFSDVRPEMPVTFSLKDTEKGVQCASVAPASGDEDVAPPADAA